MYERFNKYLRKRKKEEKSRIDPGSEDDPLGSNPTYLPWARAHLPPAQNVRKLKVGYGNW